MSKSIASAAAAARKKFGDATDQPDVLGVTNDPIVCIHRIVQGIGAANMFKGFPSSVVFSATDTEALVVQILVSFLVSRKAKVFVCLWIAIPDTVMGWVASS